MTRLPLLTILLASGLAAAAPAQSRPPAVILVTLDGARIEEIFAGLDADIVRSQLRAGERLEDQAIYKRF